MRTHDLNNVSINEFPTQAYEQAYEQGWTDGLPIIPASPENVRRFVAASGRPADQLIGILPPRRGRVTVEVIAVNAVMAGCRPGFMPLIIAAVEAMADPGFPLQHIQVTTNSETPFLLVNGPVRQSLEINCGTGCLGPGWRANATIGRAVRLLLYNGGGGLPGIYSKSSFASPLRYSFLCGENEEANPWIPFHCERGFSLAQSTVTVFAASTYCLINGSYSAHAEDILRNIATQMPPSSPTDNVLLLLGPTNARTLQDAGYTKRDIQQRLWELARLPATCFPEQLINASRAAGRGDAEQLWRCAGPEEFYIVVAGGPGPYDVYISAKSPQTRAIGDAQDSASGP